MSGCVSTGEPCPPDCGTGPLPSCWVGTSEPRAQALADALARLPDIILRAWVGGVVASMGRRGIPGPWTIDEDGTLRSADGRVVVAGEAPMAR